MDPTQWLQNLGLERYAVAFRENEIDETVLQRLTAEDLKDIGVRAIGHRRKLLDAIAALRTDAKGEMLAEVASTPSGERRQVTVMFSDLVGSTALSTRMDPEDLREVISSYQKCVADAVRRFGGFVAKYMGVGVLIYFGYPQPQQPRQKTLEALFTQVQTFASKNPVLMIFEDAHWSDPTSLEAFGRAVDRIATLPVLLLITFRPEFQPPWIGQPQVTALTLNRLTRHEVDAMIDRIAGNKQLPADVRQDIIERTDGIPLFVEEMTKAVLEAESHSEAERAAAAIPSAAVAVPVTLHASLMARLDRLGGPAKELAQIGAAIGREHSHALLALVTRKPDAELDAALDRLVAAGLLFQQGLPPHAAYLFKHALVRDVAYGSLLRDQRQQLHGRIADVLAEHFPTTVEAEPEVLANHHREAGMADAASTYFERAGDRAAARSAYIEATAHFRAAIEEADRLPKKEERARRALTLLIKLGPAIAVTIGEGKPEVEAVYRRARDLGREVGDGPKLFRATWGLWLCASRRDNKQSRKWTEELTSLAQRLGDESLLLEAQHCRWGDEMFGGYVPQLLEASEEGIRRYDPKRHTQLAEAFAGHDPGVC